MFNPRIALATLALALVGGGVTAYGVATTPPPTPVAAASAPYCMFDAELPEHVTVAGPSGGTITVDGRRVGELVLVEAIDGAEVAPDAGPYDGIQYNIPGGVIAVDGNVCETT